MPAGFDPSRALAHLRACDPVLASLIDQYGSPDFAPRPDRAPGEHYAALLRTIVGQQLSTRVAAVIWGRVLERYGGSAPTPRQVLDDDPEALRSAVGLSRAKTTYVRSLAEHVLSGELVAVKGIGEWSAQMFLMFQLGRPDVLAAGDLGVRRAVQLAYEMEKLPQPARVAELGEPWAPYRTAACRVLWHSLDNEPGG